MSLYQGVSGAVTVARSVANLEAVTSRRVRDAVAAFSGGGGGEFLRLHVHFETSARKIKEVAEQQPSSTSD